MRRAILNEQWLNGYVVNSNLPIGAPMALHHRESTTKKLIHQTCSLYHILSKSFLFLNYFNFLSSSILIRHFNFTKLIKGKTNGRISRNQSND